MTGQPGADPPRSKRRSRWWLDLVVVIVVFEIEAVVAWVGPAVDRPVWLPTAIVAAVGLLSLAGLNLFGGARSVRSRLALSGLLAAIGVLSGFVGWSLTLPTKIHDDAAANRLAERLLTHPPSDACESGERDRASVGSLMKADWVCVYGTGSRRWVAFVGGVGTSGSPTGPMARGLLYLRFSPWSEPRVVMEVCLRHLDGPWWEYQQVVLSCPLGYTGIGAA